MINLIDPAILFFILGMVAGLLKSNLEIPPQISRFLSLYLLMALGLKGGFALAHSGITIEITTSLGIAIVMSIVVPFLGYFFLKRFVSGYDAAGIAATYGSVSAVTFVTTVQYLEAREIVFGGYMAAAMALMESPAIIVAVVLANIIRRSEANQLKIMSGKPPKSISMLKILHESFTDGGQVLLLGAMVVGIISGAAGEHAMQPFSGDLFKGMLAFFLLDMGLMTSRNLPELRNRSPILLGYAIVAPVLHAAMALGLAWVFGIASGDATLLMVLAASASYIAVPAVLRFAIPEANSSIYFGLSLGITFPINILFGIPIYSAIASHLLKP
ncbi:MAG: sodium-dependent bicarbonate transport family permease [Candidatus Pacebacteria bacterium]|nr:sodium-dependent bicarbonate transport family permease [Candidatus Paceibacterota bacterium]